MKRLFSLILCLLIVVTLLPVVTAYAADEIEGEMLDEIIIKFYTRSQFPGKEKQYDDEVAKILKDGLSQVTDNVYVVKAEDLSKNPTAVLNKYKNSDFIEYVEPNYIAKCELAADDPDYRTYIKKGIAGLHLEEMWDIVTNVSTVVAVLDTGVYAAHPEFGGRVNNGYDFVNNTSSTVTDDNGHGTRVAGVIAAQGNNSVGVAGINWGAYILPVKVLDSKGIGSVSNIAKGIMWAADNGAKIINMSLGCTNDSVTLKTAVEYAAAKGCILVAAAGNTGLEKLEYPARYDNVIGVGSDTGAGMRDAYSCYGTGLDIIAVGSCRTTTMSGGTGSSSGTSFASPQVAGVLSLAMNYYPDLDAYSAKKFIEAAVVDIGTPGWDADSGYGYLDYKKFIETAQDIGTEQKPVDTTPPVITLKGDALIELFEGDTYEEPGYTAVDDIDGDITHFVTVSGLAETAYAGEYTLTYEVSDAAGNIATATRTVIVFPSEIAEIEEPEAPGAPIDTEVPEPPETPVDETVPEVPAAKAPIITQNGSNPIILHLGGSAYVEQGALATDDIDGDISTSIITSGNVDTSKAGTYNVIYSITNSAGKTSSITRQVRVLAPTEKKIGGIPLSFSGQGKSGAKFTYKVKSESAGIMTLNIGGLSKTTLLVTVKDSTGKQVFSQSFTANEKKEFWVEAGTCTIDVAITSGNGNLKFDLTATTPELIYMEFSESEVPLGEAPKTGDSDIIFIIFGLSLLSSVVILRINKKYRVSKI